MSDLFTVKLDLSTVTHGENERLYILLVDPTITKMIYQFKLWVRFLFSIDCSIKLVYESAVIHDLEDIHILKLLKTVQVERADCAVGERQQQEELMAKLSRFDEWRESVTPTVTPQRQCKLTNGDSFQTSSRQCHDLTVSKIESSERYEREENHRSRHENTLQYSSYNGSQNETGNKMRNNTFNTSSNSLQYNEFEMDLGDNYNKKCKKITQEDNSQQVSHTPKTIPKSPKTSSETMKSETSVKRRSVHKPFSLYNFLHTLRSQESNVDDNTTVKHETAMEYDKKGAPDIILNGDHSKNEEDEGQFIKRKRKRIRKHKNQRNKVNFEIETYKEAPLMHEKYILKSVSPKPKHIRFDANEDSQESIMSKPTQDESVNLKDECHYDSVPELSNDQKYDNQIGHTNETNNTVAEIGQNVQQNADNEHEVNDVSMTADDKVKNDSAQSLLDILGSLRKKSSTPPVFDRFAATCV